MSYTDNRCWPSSKYGYKPTIEVVEDLLKQACAIVSDENDWKTEGIRGLKHNYSDDYMLNRWVLLNVKFPAYSVEVHHLWLALAEYYESGCQDIYEAEDLAEDMLKHMLDWNSPEFPDGTEQVPAWIAEQTAAEFLNLLRENGIQLFEGQEKEDHVDYIHEQEEYFYC